LHHQRAFSATKTSPGATNGRIMEQLQTGTSVRCFPRRDAARMRGIARAASTRDKPRAYGETQMKAIKRSVSIFAISIGVLSIPNWAAQLAPPAFIPPYYEAALALDGAPLRLVSKLDAKGKERAVYASRDGAVTVMVESLSCDRTSCEVFYEQRLKDHNVELTSAGCRFRSVTQIEFAAEWKSKIRSATRRRCEDAERPWSHGHAVRPRLAVCATTTT
jgi:hypothetical protein